MHNNFYHDDSNRSLTSKALNIKVFVLIFVLHSMSNNANYVKSNVPDIKFTNTLLLHRIRVFQLNMSFENITSGIKRNSNNYTGFAPNFALHLETLKLTKPQTGEITD